MVLVAAGNVRELEAVVERAVTAALLGLNPSTLRSRMRKHGIRRPKSRPPDASPPREG